MNDFIGARYDLREIHWWTPLTTSTPTNLGPNLELRNIELAQLRNIEQEDEKIE